jgi:hypothetical protein
MQKSSLLLFVIAVHSTIALAAQPAVAIPQNIEYYDVNIIQDNVVRECATLGADLSSYVAQNLESTGYAVKRVPPAEMSSGPSIDVKIMNLMSAGNAFTGHKKNVSVSAKIQNDGKVTDSKSFTRSSMGGFAAGFKSSCAVLDRTVEALGRDIANWYRGRVPSVAATDPAAPEPAAQ